MIWAPVSPGPKIIEKDVRIVMKKKILTAMLALAMVLALAACGGGNSSGSGGNAGTPSSSAPSGGGSEPAAEGKTYSWQIGNVLAADQPWDIGLVKFAELLNEYSGGRMEATVQSGGVLGSEIAMLESVQMGTLDFAICSTPSMSGFVDSQNYFDLPYMFQSIEGTWAVMDDWLAADRCAALEGSGFKGLGYFENGTYMVGSNIYIEHPSDMEGVRVRSHSSNLQSDAFSAIGAMPLSVAWGDIYTALQQKTIDAVSGTTLTNMYGGKFYEQCKYITMTNHHFIPSLVVMNEDLWNSLSADDQAIVQKAFDEAMTYQREIAFEYADTYRQNIEDYGVEIIDVDAAEWAEAMSSVYDKYVGTVGIEADMITRIQESEASLTG